MIKIIYSILILCIILQFLQAQKNNHKRNNIEEEEDLVIEKKFQRHPNIGKDMKKKQQIWGKELVHLQQDAFKNPPLIPDHPNVMFWRPQKVGSSTILSILISKGWRYNLLPRRKGGNNGLCAKIAQCFSDNNIDEDNEYMSIYKENYSSFRSTLNDSLSKRFTLPYKRPKQLKIFLKDYLSLKVPGAGGGRRKQSKKAEIDAETMPYRISTNHQLCNLDAFIVKEALNCAFIRPDLIDGKPPIIPVDKTEYGIKEVFVVRNPLDRAISVYYFWGELFKLGTINKISQRRDHPTHDKYRNKGEKDIKNLLDVDNKFQGRIGDPNIDIGVVKGSLFTYHGNESSVPPTNIAVAFANNLCYSEGMPGPTYTWSAFSNNLAEAVDILKTDRMMTIVTERLDESLVVCSHYLGWSIADMVVTMHRKASSSHPKHSAWPIQSIKILKDVLTTRGEYEIYNVADMKLTSRIKQLKIQGIDIDKEIKLLKDMRTRVTELCLSPLYLEVYRRHLGTLFSILSYSIDIIYIYITIYLIIYLFIYICTVSHGFFIHQNDNKLRDVDNVYTDNGHAFSYNKDIIYSFDICGNCEAHAILYSIENGLATNVENGKIFDFILFTLF